MIGPLKIFVFVTVGASVCAAALLLLRDAICLYLARRRRLGPSAVASRGWLRALGAGLVWFAIFESIARTRGWGSFTPQSASINALAAGLLSVFFMFVSWPYWGLWLLAASYLAALYGHPLLGGMFFAVVLVCALLRHDGIGHRRRMANVMQEVAEALRQALPLHEIFEALSVEQRGPFARDLRLVAERLRRGAPLSAALALPGFVPHHTLAAIRAGEAGGGRALPQLVRGAAADLRAGAAARSSVLVALYYPLAVWAFCLPMAAFLLVFIIPKFSDVLRHLPAHFPSARFPAGVPAPQITWWPAWHRATEIVVFVSVGVVSGVLLACYFAASGRGPGSGASLWQRLRLLRLSLWLQDCLPLLRTRLRLRCLARSASTLGAMLECGVPLHQACREVAVPELAGPFARRFAAFARGIEQGQPLSAALRGSRLPESFTALAEAGAAGGQLPLALATAAEWHAARAQRFDRVFAVALPCLTIPLTGLLVGSLYGGLFAAMRVMHEALRPPGLGG